MHTPIDLGRESEFPGQLSNPVSPSTDTQRYYPEFQYSGDKELDLPKEGTMTIRYCVTREVEEKRNGKDWYQCTVEVKEILSVEGEKDDMPTKRDTSASDALDAIAMSLSKLKAHEESEGDED
jgi:hypothetical protein